MEEICASLRQLVFSVDGGVFQAVGDPFEHITVKLDQLGLARSEAPCRCGVRSAPLWLKLNF